MDTKKKSQNQNQLKCARFKNAHMKYIYIYIYMYLCMYLCMQIHNTLCTPVLISFHTPQRYVTSNKAGKQGKEMRKQIQYNEM